jgi:hypothetical protein
MLPVRERQQEYQLHQLTIREGHKQALRSPCALATFQEMQRKHPGSLSAYATPTELALSLEKGGPDIRDGLTRELTELARQGANAISSLAIDLLCLGFWHDLCDLQIGRKAEGPGQLCSEVYVVFLEHVRDMNVRYDTAAMLMGDVGRALESEARKQRRKPRAKTCENVDELPLDDEVVHQQRDEPFAADIGAAVPRLREELEEIFGEADGRLFVRAHLFDLADVAAQEGLTADAMCKRLSRLRGIMNEHLVARNETIIIFHRND